MNFWKSILALGANLGYWVSILDLWDLIYRRLVEDFWPLWVDYGHLGVDFEPVGVNFEPLEVDSRHE